LPVSGITFNKLTFTHTDRKAWGEYEQREGWGLQHDWDMFDSPTAMLRFRGAAYCQVVQCQFTQGGGSGVRFDLYAQKNQVLNSEFKHLGEAGILLVGYGPGTKDVNKHNNIINNHIHNFSEIMWHSPGIWAWQSGHNLIKNNYVHHNNYSSVLITCRVDPNQPKNAQGGRTIRHAEIPKNAKDKAGRIYEEWKIREPYLHGRNNLLEYNEITHTMQRMGDGNAFYVSGAGANNIVRYNYIHDNLIPSKSIFMLRCDDDQHETLFYGNIIDNNFGGSIKSKGNNDVINNIITNMEGYIAFSSYPSTGAVVKKNIIIANSIIEPVTKAKTRVEEQILLSSMKIDSNLYFHPTNKEWLNNYFEILRKGGNEKSSLFGNPLFINTKKGDFGFKEGSPALELGIEPLNTSKMGLIK